MIKLSNIHIAYDRVLIDNGSMEISPAAVTLIHGLSGSGKSTLLYRIGLIAKDHDYAYSIDGLDVMKLNDSERSQLKRQRFGYVLQDASLYEQYDVLGNLQLYAKVANKEYDESAYREILQRVKLNLPFDQRIETLSGGERQRLSIACALCKEPSVLIMDEPTSALDQNNEILIFKILRQLAHETGITVIISSHSRFAQAYADSIYTIKEQQLLCIGQAKQKTETIIETEQHRYPLSFYLDYIRYFFQRYRYLNITLCGMIALCFTLSAISIGVIDHYAKQSVKDLLPLQDNIIFTTGDKNYTYVEDEGLPVISSSQLTALQSMDTPHEIDPYRKVMTTLQDREFYILPYYDEAVLKSTTEEVVQKREHGVYLSYNAATYLTSKDITLSLDISVIENGVESVHHTSQSFAVAGHLLSDVQPLYLQKSHDFIYVYYEDIEHLYAQFSTSQEFKGYTIRSANVLDSIDINRALQKLQKKHAIGINEGIFQFEDIYEQMQTSLLYRSVVIAVFLIVFTLMLSATQMNYFYKRDHEFALLKINGLSNYDIRKLSTIEIVVKLVLGFVSSVVLFALTLFILNVSKVLLMELDIMHIVWMILADVIVIMGASLLFARYYIKHLIPESILRK